MFVGHKEMLTYRFPIVAIFNFFWYDVCRGAIKLIHYIDEKWHDTLSNAI